MKVRVKSKYTSLVITIGIFLALVVIGSFAYDNFFDAQNLVNLLIDNSFLIIVSLGETLVIISGGIDLSVGSLIALVSMVAAYLLTTLHCNPILVMLIVIAVGCLVGLLHGISLRISTFSLLSQPWLNVSYPGAELCHQHRHGKHIEPLVCSDFRISYSILIQFISFHWRNHYLYHASNVYLYRSLYEIRPGDLCNWE